MSKYVLASELEDAKKKLLEDAKRFEEELRKTKFALSDEMSKVVSKWEDTVKAEKEQHKDELESLRNELMFEEHEHQVRGWVLEEVHQRCAGAGGSPPGIYLNTKCVRRQKRALFGVILKASNDHI